MKQVGNRPEERYKIIFFGSSRALMKEFCRFLRYSPYIIVEYKREGLDNMEDKKK